MGRRFLKIRRLLAFSLLEVLVAVGVLAILVPILLSVFGSMQDGVGGISASTSRRQDGRVVLAAITREIRETLSPLHQNYEGFPQARQFHLLINPPSVPAGLQNPHSIFWNSNRPGRDGGTRLIGYFIRWDESTPEAPRPILCRMAIPTPQTLEVLSQLQISGGSDWTTPVMLDTFAPGGVADGLRGWLADNVVAIYIRALDPNQEPILRMAREITGTALGGGDTIYATFATGANGADYLAGRYDAQLGYQYRNRATEDAPGVTRAWVNQFGPVLPPMIEVAIVVLSPSGLRKLSAVPAPVSGGAGSLWSDIDRFIASLPPEVGREAKVFSTLIALPQTP